MGDMKYIRGFLDDLPESNEPTENIRGDIARTYFYMDWAYPDRSIISHKNRKLFQAWNYADPVDTWECQRAAMTTQLQGNVNPFVTDLCNSMAGQ